MESKVLALPRYLGQHGADYHKERCAVPESMFNIVARLRARKFQPHIRALDYVLEYGSGLGYNLSALRCLHRKAFDVGGHLAQHFAKLGIPFQTETASYPDGIFHAAICHHVLEHVPDPWKVLTELRRLVRPGGVLILNVPYERERSYRRYDPNEPNGHVFSWNPQTLGNLAVAAGWSIDSLTLPLCGYDRVAAVIAAKIGGSEMAYLAIRRTLLLLRPRYEIQAVLRRLS